MKKFLQLSIISVLLLTPVLAQNNASSVAASDSGEFIGEYIYNGYVGAVFKIIGDGTYEYHTFSDCCDAVWKESGSYVLMGNLLHFKITTRTLDGYNMLDPEQVAEAYRKVYKREDADIQDIKIQTEYDMHIVRWGERIYLLDPDRINLFTAAVNFGLEPRRGPSSNYITYRFYLRRGDADKQVAGNPVLPEPWISYLQASPIKAVVTKIELQNQETIYTVNKGSTDGMKVGMCLIKENTTPDYKNFLVVISVEAGSAKLKIPPDFGAPNYQSGDTLITKTSKNPR